MCEVIKRKKMSNATVAGSSVVMMELYISELDSLINYTKSLCAQNLISCHVEKRFIGFQTLRNFEE